MTMPSQGEVGLVLLRVLRDRGGEGQPKELYGEVAAHFPDMTAADRAQQVPSGDNKWRNRVRFARNDLAKLGYIDRSERGVWKLTEAGWRKARSAEVLPPSNGEQETDGDPPVVERPTLVFVTNTAENIASALREAASAGDDSVRLERAVADAMRYFGFDAELLGGPGKTDVLIEAPLGPRSYRVVIDAKSTAKSRVTASQVDFLSIDGHRKNEGADYICVVGSAFAGGQLVDRAEEFGAAMLCTDDLADLVLLHAEHPLSLHQLRPLFQSSPHASDAIAEIRAAARERARLFRLVQTVIESMDEFNRTSVDEIIAKPEVIWGAIFKTIPGVTRNDVAAVLDLLSTLGVVEQSNGDGYVSLTSPSGAAQILRALTRSAGSVGDADQVLTDPTARSS